MIWAPCPVCGADGFRLRADDRGHRAECPSCGLVLAAGPTHTDCLLQYTRKARA